MVVTNKNRVGLIAGAATSNITPLKPLFLFGYPFVERVSERVNDWMLSSALYLASGNEQVLLISNDIIYVSRKTVSRIRRIVSQKTGVPQSNILVAATHTHSGPVTVDCLNSSNDKVVPKADVKYVRYMEDKTIEAAINAHKNAIAAKVAFFVADATGVGTNRHNPNGPADMEVPALIFKNRNNEVISCLLACNMHPTILHEDSKAYSADFPGFTREILQKEYFGSESPIIYFTGAAGNQSPRHVTKNNTFDEAQRIGRIVAKSVGEIFKKGVEYSADISLLVIQKNIDLPRRNFPELSQAKTNRDAALKHFEHLKNSSKNNQEIRTAEVDWFGAEELLHLTSLKQSGALEKAYQSCLPAEIQVIKIENWSFVAWPGEIFVEYLLTLKDRLKNTFLITLANGDLQGYIATKQAEKQGYYEASNSLFDTLAGDVLVTETVKLIKETEQ